MSEELCLIPIDPHVPPEERVPILNELALRGAEDPDVQRVTREAIRGLQSDREIAEALLRRVHAVPFWAYPPKLECFAPAGKVLERGGDCDNLSVLYAASCLYAGIPASVVWINQPKSKLNHVTAVVFLDGEWQWADPSIKGARIGETPYEAAHRTGNGAPLGIAPGGQIEINADTRGTVRVPIAGIVVGAVAAFAAGFWIGKRSRR